MPYVRTFVILALSFLSLSVQAQETRTLDLQFEQGATGTTVHGAISDYDTTNYRLRAKTGQQIRVALETDNAANYFNIFAPGKGPGDQAMFIGSTAGNTFSGKLPADGVYTVQLYLMRSAARRNESANYTLKIMIEP